MKLKTEVRPYSKSLIAAGYVISRYHSLSALIQINCTFASQLEHVASTDMGFTQCSAKFLQ